MPKPRPRPDQLPPKLGRRARRKVELRERILRSALDLFARQGFFATTVEQITEAADVGKGTFFNYFPSKEHVLAGFGQMQLARLQAALEEMRTQQPDSRQLLRRLAHALAEEPGRSQSLVRSLMVANLSSEPVRRLFRRNMARGRRRLARLIRYGQQRGEIASQHNPALLARLFQQTYMGTMLLWAISPATPLKQWVDPTFEFFWHGASVTGPPGARGKGGKR